MREIKPGTSYARINAVYGYKVGEIPDVLTEPMLLNLASNLSFVSEQAAAPIVAGFGEIMAAVLESFGGTTGKGKR